MAATTRSGRKVGEELEQDEGEGRAEGRNHLPEVSISSVLPPFTHKFVFKDPTSGRDPTATPPPTSATLGGSQEGAVLRKSRATRPKSRLPLEEKEGREREEAYQEEGDLNMEPLEPPVEEPMGIRPP